MSAAEKLPLPGETLTGASFSRTFGGKGANQAVAAASIKIRRNGAQTGAPLREEVDRFLASR